MNLELDAQNGRSLYKWFKRKAILNADSSKLKSKRKINN